MSPTRRRKTNHPVPHGHEIVDQTATTERAAVRKRVAAETADAEAARVPVKLIFVERAGSAPAAAALEAALGLIESQIGVHVERVAN